MLIRLPLWHTRCVRGRLPMNKVTLWLVAIFLVGAVAIAEAQQQKKIPRLGYFTLSGGPSDRDEAFKQGLRELGWVDRQNIMIEYRPEKRSSSPLLQMSWSGSKNATNTIPIVMPGASDPVGSGFITSLARPGGNITGMSAMILELEGKRLELLREVAPRVSRVAFLAYGTDLTAQRGIKEARDAGQRLGVRIQPVRVEDPKDIESAFSAMVKERAGAVAIQPLLITSIGQGRRIARLATPGSAGTRLAHQCPINLGADNLSAYLPRICRPVSRANGREFRS